MSHTHGTSDNLIRALKRLGVLDTTIRDCFSGFPEGARRPARIRPKFSNAQRKIASLLAIRRGHAFGWVPPPGADDTDAVLVRAGTGVILTGPSGKPVTRMG